MESLLNFTASLMTAASPTPSSLYIYTSLVSGIFIAVLAFITTTGNGLLLLAIWKDPLKTLRTPTTYFVIGLTTADFLTGLFVSPVAAFRQIVNFCKPALGRSEATKTAKDFTASASLLTMNTSYLILVLLTWSQFAAISFPHQHRNLVSKRRVGTCVVLAYLYAFTFALLPALGVEDDLLDRLDLFMNTLPLLSLLILAYTCLHVAYRRQVRRISTLRTQPVNAACKVRSRRRERQFTTVNLLLVLFVLVCTLPATIIWIFRLYRPNMPAERNATLNIVALHAGSVLFLKFALDPFLYCWRLPHYRRSLRSVLMCEGRRAQPWQTASVQTPRMSTVGFVRSPSRRQFPEGGRSSAEVQNCRVVEMQSEA